MTTAKMHDLTFRKLEDGTIQLEQQWGIDDPVTIEVHPSQLRHVAEAVGLLEPAKPPGQPRALKKRLERLRSRLVDIHDDLAAAPIYPPGSGSSADDPEVQALWDAVVALEDVMDDYFEEPGDETETAPDGNPPGLRAAEFSLTSPAAA